jgi:hypothetical protein
MATKRASHPSSGRRSGVLLLAAALALAGFALAARPPGGGGGGGGGGKTKTPAISVSPSSLAFGDVTVNTTSAAQSVTVTNSGRANLLITSITRSGSTAFAFTENCPDTLAVGASCAISVTFAPTATGAAAGSIAIVSNASNTPNVTVALSGSGTAAPSVAVRRGKGAGDSIMRGYNANCTSNTGLFDFICYGAGDKPQYSFFNGSSSSVTSIVARYVQLDPLFGGDQNAAASGSEMTDPTKNNFATQAAAIVGSASQPARVFVELGGNDLCNRATIGDLYSD